ncbi:MAG: cyanase [Pseudonocardiales bacterium]|nr:cyanase [Pseudonocardiales bacterium]
MAPLDRREAAQAVIAAKDSKDLRWSDLAQALQRSTEWTTSALLGQQPLTEDQARTVGKLLDLDAGFIDALTLPPIRGADVVDTSEPLVYRLQEMVQVYGPTIAELVREEFGDGIVSAIDFEFGLERVPDPKGDRVKITLHGKFLPYRVW